jgi:hypothetical protein
MVRERHSRSPSTPRVLSEPRNRFRGIRICSSLLCSALVVLGTAVHAKTWEVACATGECQGLVGRAVEDAASGDTIVVLPGVYLESIDLGDKRLVIESAGGPDSTTLALTPGVEASVIYSIRMTEGLVLRGFTVRGGRGTINTDGTPMGGGLYLGPPDRHRWIQQVTIDDCVFEENQVAPDGYPPWFSSGGGLAIESVDEVVLNDCVFRGNFNRDGTHDVYLSPSHVHITNCEFVATRDGEQVRVEGGEECQVVDCSFWGKATVSLGSSLLISTQRTILTHNRFIDLAGPLVTKVSIVDEALGETLSRLFVNRNTFYVAPGDWGRTGTLWGQFDVGDVTVESNTFVGVGLSLGFDPLVTEGHPTTIEKNIIVNGTIGVGNGSGGRIACTVWWPAQDLRLLGPFEVVNQVVGDPMFCDAEALDFRVNPDGVCGPEHSPGDCGVIGAESADCAQTPILVTLDATCGTGGTEVSWIASGDADLLETRIYRSESSRFDEAELVASVPPDQGRFLDASTAAGAVRWYWVGVVDTGGAEHLAGPVDSLCEVEPGAILRLESRNPSVDGIFHFRVALTFPRNPNRTTLSVHDVTGREVARQSLVPAGSGGAVTLDLSDQPGGVYYVTVSGDGTILGATEIVVLH